jgi:uncharacterized membrane protein
MLCRESFQESLRESFPIVSGVVSRVVSALFARELSIGTAGEGSLLVILLKWRHATTKCCLCSEQCLAIVIVVAQVVAIVARTVSARALALVPLRAETGAFRASFEHMVSPRSLRRLKLRLLRRHMGL